MEINAAQQAEDPIAEEMRWFWDNEEAESDSDSVPESGPDSDADHSDTDDNDSDDDGAKADELVFELQQHPYFEAIHPMVHWLEIGLLRSLLTEENLRIMGQVINQLQQDEEEEDNLQKDEADEEEADVPAGGIEINPPQVEGPWVNNRAEIPAGEMEINAAQQAEDPIAEEMRWFWDNEEAESDSDSVPESGPDSDADHSDTDDNDSDDDGAKVGGG
ncbi:sorting nexin-25 [Sarotherodon galilaeus]